MKAESLVPSWAVENCIYISPCGVAPSSTELDIGMGWDCGRINNYK